MGQFEDEDPIRTPLSELGEFALIDHLTRNFQITNGSTLTGIGDDAAVLTDGSERVKVVTTDMLVEGVHFDLSYVPLRHLGYKSMVINFSDVYAMNAQPQQVTVAIAVSNRFSVEALEEIYDGMHMACKLYGVDLIGGDTTSSMSGLIISVTAIGSAKRHEVVLRSSAREGDLLVVSGDLGGAYMGLQILEREKAVFWDNPNMQPELQGHEYVLGRQLKPEARKDIPELLKQLEVRPTAMTDISDGLSCEALHIARKSSLGVRLYEEKFPIDPNVLRLCEEFQLDPTVPVLNGGEDYELLFAIAQDDYDRIRGNPDLTVVGHMTAGEACYLISRDGKMHPLTSQGWDAILKKEGS